MNDLSYPLMSQDLTKAGGALYSTEPSCFVRPNPINRSSSFSQTQEYDQWRSNSLPSSMTLPINSSPINNNSNDMNIIPSSSSNTTNNPATNPVSCDLQEVIIYYQSQPELLRLILLSKVEEDKRRSEEAKLRAKELDMFLLQQQQQLAASTPQTPDATMMSSTPPLVINTSPLSNDSNNSKTITNHNMSVNSCNNTNESNTLLIANPFGPTPRRPSALEMLLEESDCNRRDSALGSSFDGSANSDEFDDRSISPNATSAAASMLSMSFPPTSQPMMSMNNRNSNNPLSPSFNSIPQTTTINGSPFTPQAKVDSNCASPDQTQQTSGRSAPYFPQRPRRRREMQAISKIVETREYPYADGFFWKNNGNTIQKKTGNKSVYYKCSNSSKGCPVNKTVTWKDNGEYLIKYRGEHLADCGKVQRIVDM